MAADAHRHQGSRRFLIICWGGVTCGIIVVGASFALDEAAIDRSAWLTVTLALLATYYGVVGLTLWWQIFELWRWWCFLFLVPWIWPPLGAVTFALTPLIFLSWVTARLAQVDRLTRSAP